ERRLSSSALPGGSAVTRLSASNFAQLILVGYHNEPGLVQYLLQKRIVRLALPVEFRRGVDRGINFTAERLPRAPKRQSEILGRHLSHHHQVNIALAVLAARGDGAVDECRCHLPRKRLQRLRQ